MLLYHTIDSPETFYNVQNDINEVAMWLDMNHLTLNKEKCKLMLISRKKYCSNPPVPLTLYGQTLDSVNTYKYLGVYLTHDLTWSEHACRAKAKRLIGLIYRKFYNFSSCATLMQLYKLRIWSYLEYASVVWSPHLEKDKKMLEDVQKFGLRMSTKHSIFIFKKHLMCLQCTHIHTLDYLHSLIIIISKFAEQSWYDEWKNSVWRCHCSYLG